MNIWRFFFISNEHKINRYGTEGIEGTRMRAWYKRDPKVLYATD